MLLSRDPPDRIKSNYAMNRCLTIGLLVCGIVACDKSQPIKESPQAAALNAAASASERVPTAPSPQNPRDFGAMFQNEAANRPTGTIKAEDAMTAFRNAGIELDRVRQHLGRPYGARYCVGAISGAAIAISVCEYIDAAAAKAGADLSRKIVLANREIQINQATSLTVREVEKTPAAEEIAKKLFESFAKLKSV
jgi:hypothetical protein